MLSRHRSIWVGWLLLVVLAFGGLSARPVGAAERGQVAPLRLGADLACRPGGGADLTLTIENLGAEPLTIADIHLALGAVRPGGQEGISIVFLFPAPEAATVPPGGSQTFLVGFGDVFEPGEEPPDLSGARLILGVDVFLRGRDRPVVRHFSFPGCAA